MRFSDKAIVLQAVRHGDRQSIVKLYTRGHGFFTVIASPSRSSGAKIRQSSLMPLTLLDIVATLRQNRELHRLSEASCYYVHDNLGSSIVKLGIAQFINELLLKTLREQQGNVPLFDFVETTLTYLNDADRDFVNTHLYFLRELSVYLGFEPHNNCSSGTPFFDCREGAFSGMALPFPLGLPGPDSALFSRSLRSNLLREEISRQERQLLLEAWLAYYALHVPGFGEMRSLDVLREISEAMRS